MNWRYLCILSGWVFCHQALAYDLLLGVRGAIADNGCIVSAESQNMTVAMGNVALKQFYADDVAFGKRPFVIKLEKCGALAAGVRVTFKGDQSPDNPVLLALTQEPDVATGLAIEILDENSLNLPINIPMITPVAIDSSSGVTNDLLFHVQYRAVGIVSAGMANAIVDFVLEYQ